MTTSIIDRVGIVPSEYSQRLNIGTLFFQLQSIDIILIFHENICWGYSLEAPQ